MLTILLWSVATILVIYLLGFFAFAGVMTACLVEGHSSWPEVKKLIIWVLIWPSWAPRTIWYLWGKDFMDV